MQSVSGSKVDAIVAVDHRRASADYFALKTPLHFLGSNFVEKAAAGTVSR